MKKNYFCRTLTDNARHKNIPSPLESMIWLESWCNIIKGMIQENS